MELKAVWKVLSANDVSTHFFTQQAIVYNDEDGNPALGQIPSRSVWQDCTSFKRHPGSRIGSGQHSCRPI
jgi:hypothetical protein